MQTIQSSILINAEKHTVWNALHLQLNSREGIAAFSNDTGDESGYILKQTPWGDKILSHVVRYSPFEVFSIKHEAIFKDEQADYWHPEIKDWVGLYEIYRLSETKEQTVLHVEADCPGKHGEWIQHQIQRTLDQVKLISEQVMASIMHN